MRLPTLLAALVVLGAGCARNPSPGEEAAPARTQPLSGLSGESIVVLPARFLRSADSLGWALPEGREFLDRLDGELKFAAEQRGVGESWVWPEEIVRLARRNPSFAPDPRLIAAEPLRPRPRRGRDAAMLVDPLRSQLRSLVALRDARYALVPVELRFEKRGGGTGRAVLHVAVVDARLARVTWAGDVASDPAVDLTPALAAGIAERFADLFAAR